MELGCFMAGTVISSQGEVVTLKVCGFLKVNHLAGIFFNNRHREQTDFMKVVNSYKQTRVMITLK